MKSYREFRSGYSSEEVQQKPAGMLTFTEFREQQKFMGLAYGLVANDIDPQSFCEHILRHAQEGQLNEGLKDFLRGSWGVGKEALGAVKRGISNLGKTTSDWYHKHVNLGKVKDALKHVTKLRDHLRGMNYEDPEIERVFTDLTDKLNKGAQRFSDEPGLSMKDVWKDKEEDIPWALPADEPQPKAKPKPKHAGKLPSFEDELEQLKRRWERKGKARFGPRAPAPPSEEPPPTPTPKGPHIHDEGPDDDDDGGGGGGGAVTQAPVKPSPFGPIGTATYSEPPAQVRQAAPAGEPERKAAPPDNKVTAPERPAMAAAEPERAAMSPAAALPDSKAAAPAVEPERVAMSPAAAPPENKAAAPERPAAPVQPVTKTEPAAGATGSAAAPPAPVDKAPPVPTASQSTYKDRDIVHALVIDDIQDMMASGEDMIKQIHEDPNILKQIFNRHLADYRSEGITLNDAEKAALITRYKQFLPRKHARTAGATERRDIDKAIQKLLRKPDTPAHELLPVRRLKQAEPETKLAQAAAVQAPAFTEPDATTATKPEAPPAAEPTTATKPEAPPAAEPTTGAEGQTTEPENTPPAGSAAAPDKAQTAAPDDDAEREAVKAKIDDIRNGQFLTKQDLHTLATPPKNAEHPDKEARLSLYYAAKEFFVNWKTGSQRWDAEKEDWWLRLLRHLGGYELVKMANKPMASLWGNLSKPPEELADTIYLAQKAFLDKYQGEKENDNDIEPEKYGGTDGEDHDDNSAGFDIGDHAPSGFVDHYFPFSMETQVAYFRDLLRMQQRPQVVSEQVMWLPISKKVKFFKELLVNRNGQ